VRSLHDPGSGAGKPALGPLANALANACALAVASRKVRNDATSRRFRERGHEDPLREDAGGDAQAAPGRRGEGKAPHRPAHAGGRRAVPSRRWRNRTAKAPGTIRKRVSPGLVHAQPGPRVGERGECALRGGALPGCAPEVPRGAGRRARVAGDPLQRRETPRVVAGRHVWGLTYRIVTRSCRGIRTSPSGNPRGPRGPSRLNSGRAPAESRSARRAHTLARLHEKRAPSRR
jgi:hypothetical protein